ncbi:MAG: hypothetical protein OEN56_08010 [Gemmatimonadota bacterium]|nr:hypothetical protein [Gemmatimonadota bacterium]
MKSGEAEPDFPGKRFISEPVIDLRYEIEVLAEPGDVWPWILQMGYHRAGWYIDAWWDKLIQEQFWPRVVPKEARGTYQAPANRILSEYQTLSLGDIVPDGPPGTAFFEVVGIEPNRLLLLFATSHFNYMAPRFVYRTRWAPTGAFCWAFVLSERSIGRTCLTSWWQAEVRPVAVARVLRPLLAVVDRAHQREILRGIKKRVERAHVRVRARR